MSCNNELWKEIVHEGEKYQSHPVCNCLDRDDVETILATMEYFGATNVWMRQTAHDLTFPKFRVFDWLAMCVMNRNDDDRRQNEQALKVLVHAFRDAGYRETRFIENLRTHDYECERTWEEMQIEDKIEVKA